MTAAEVSFAKASELLAALAGWRSSLMDEALAIGTSAVSRVEVGAALARAARGNRLDTEGARRAQEQFAEDWPDFGKVPVTDRLLTRAEGLAWKHGLRAYDAVQLAAALVCEQRARNSTRASWSHASTMS